jgi:hypothetical protein
VPRSVPRSSLSLFRSEQRIQILFSSIKDPTGPQQRVLTLYIQDQGSRIMPLSWLEALKQSDGSPFLADNLNRYGYLTNPANSNGLPVGFTASGPQGSQVVGMSCAACHTRQIFADGKEYRIDGGPAIVDFQSFLLDLDTAVGKVLGDDPAFQAFARSALGIANPTSEDLAAPRENVQAWYLRYHTLMTGALPKVPWGPSRLDAVSMIFNRLTGLDSVLLRATSFPRT